MAYSSSASVDKSIRERLLSLQSSFFQSLQSGTDALAALYQELTGFHETVSLCEPDLEDETCVLICSFAQMCSAVIPGLIDLTISSEKINQEQSLEFNKLLGELSLDDTTSLEPETYPLYIQPAHVWLLNNVHNPYPSKQTRASLSKLTNTPQKDIDSWFTDVRKRIGWNSLRKKHFSTRKDIITAATRFFKPSSTQLDPRTELDDTAHFDQEFALIEDNVKNLYSRRFSTTTLANRLDALKDLTPKTNHTGLGQPSARQASSQEIESISEPSPSPEFVSPSPPTFLSLSPAPSPPPPQPFSQSRKRRQSSSDRTSNLEAQPFKRPRIDVSADPSTRPPLPPTQSTSGKNSPSRLDFSPPSIPANFISMSESSRKRKRRPSDSDDQGRMKRVHCTPPPPSNYSVEPLAADSSNLGDLEHWLKSLSSEGLELSHSIPEPVYETSPLSAPVEIDLYRYASSSPSTSVSSLEPSTPPDYNSFDSLTTSHQSLSWLEPPPLTKAPGYDSLADVTSQLLLTNWSTENFFFDSNSAGTLDADFSSQNWDLRLASTMSTNNYSIPQVLQGSADNSTQLWTNEEPAVPISIPTHPNQISTPVSLSDIGGGTLLPRVSQRPSQDKKGANMRYLQTLLNEVQNVRFELAI